MWNPHSISICQDDGQVPDNRCSTESQDEDNTDQNTLTNPRQIYSSSGLDYDCAMLDTQKYFIQGQSVFPDRSYPIFSVRIGGLVWGRGWETPLEVLCWVSRFSLSSALFTTISHLFLLCASLQVSAGGGAKQSQSCTVWGRSSGAFAAIQPPLSSHRGNSCIQSLGSRLLSLLSVCFTIHTHTHTHTEA